MAILTVDSRVMSSVTAITGAQARIVALAPVSYTSSLDGLTHQGFVPSALALVNSTVGLVTGTNTATVTYTNAVENDAGVVIASGIPNSVWSDNVAKFNYPGDSTWSASVTQNVYQQLDMDLLIPDIVSTLQTVISNLSSLQTTLHTLLPAIPLPGF